MHAGDDGGGIVEYPDRPHSIAVDSNNMSGAIPRPTPPGPAGDSQTLPSHFKNGAKRGGGVNGGGSPRPTVATPLSAFVEAKSDIQKFMGNLQTIIHELNKLVKDLADSTDIVSETETQCLDGLVVTVSSISDAFDRDKMKVVFFGRTSNGKSTAINAMLHSKVLPQGIGHTTRCFIQVEGSKTGEKYLVTEDKPDEKRDLNSLNDLAHALNSEYLAEGGNMGEDALVNIYWPKSDSKLLQNEVVLLDSPGVDLSPEFDSWIDKHCLDADVFVLVCNAEATLTQAEKNFFHRVSKRLSKPNIFILNNRWDRSADEPEHERIEDVKRQHMYQLSKFLVSEIQVCTQEEAKNRIFFVSAREVLAHRQKDRGINTPTNFIADGFQARYVQFDEFEKQFEACISKSAIRTKFEAHCKRGKEIVSILYNLLDHLHAATRDKKEMSSQAHQNQLSQLRSSQQQLYMFTNQAKEEIGRLSAEVQLKVANDFSEELRRLQAIIDNFYSHKVNFGQMPQQLQLYRDLLVDFVDESITSDLVGRCTVGLSDRIIKMERDFVEGVRLRLPDKYSTKVDSVLQYRTPFQFSIHVDCHSLMSDFREDLEFRFSLGLSTLIRRFANFQRGGGFGSTGGAWPDTMGQNIFGIRQISRSSSNGSLASTSNASLVPTAVAREEADGQAVLINSLVMTSAQYVANGGVGVLLLTAVVYRTVGWKVIACAAGGYLGLYAYEYLKWNNPRAKERAFKQQFCDHLAVRLKHMSQTHTMTCEGQVKSEVQEVWTRLMAAATDVHQNVKGELDELDNETKHYDAVAQQLATSKFDLNRLRDDLDGFVAKYLHSESPHHL